MLPNIINQTNDYPPIQPEIILQLFQAFRKKENEAQDGEAINNAMQQLVFYQTNSPGELIAICANFLLLDGLELPVYQLFTIILNDILKTTLNVEFVNADGIPKFWKEMDNSIKDTIKQGVFRGLMFDDQVNRNCSAQAISLITRLECFSESASQIFVNIFQMLSSDQYGMWSKYGGVRALGEIFDLNLTNRPFLTEGAFNLPEIGENVFKLTLTILQAEGTPSDFKIEAAKTLRTALPIFHDFVADQFEALIKVIVAILPIGIDGYNLLLKCAKCFYNQLTGEILGFIFNAVTTDMSNEDVDKQLISIGFCSRFAKFEFKKYRSLDDSVSFLNITDQICKQLTVPLLQILLNDLDEGMVDVFDENPRENVSSNVISTLERFAKFGDSQEFITTTILAFFTENSQIDKWNCKYGSLYSLFSIVSIEDNPTITAFFMQLLPTLCQIITNDPKDSIQCIAILLMGKIVIHNFKTILEQNALADMITLTAQLIQNENIKLSTAALMITKQMVNIIGSPFFLSKDSEIKYLTYITLCPSILSCFDRTDIFTEGYFDKLLDAFHDLIFNGPSYLNEHFEMISTPLIELSNRLDSALSMQFPDEGSKLTMIGGLSKALIPVISKFPTAIVIEQMKEPCQAIIMHLIEVFLGLVASPNEITALNAIDALVLNDIDNIVSSSIGQIIEILMQSYSTSQSPETLQSSASIIGDIIVKYPSSISQELAVQLFETTFRYFNSSYLLSFQIRIFQLVGDLLTVIQDTECALAEQVIHGLQTLKSFSIHKTDHETKKLQLQTMLHVSKQFIWRYHENLPLIKRYKMLLFSAALDVNEVGYQQDRDLLKSFLDFIYFLLLQEDLANMFCTLLQRNDISQTIRDIQIPDLRGNVATTLRNLNIRFGKGKKPKIAHRRG